MNDVEALTAGGRSCQQICETGRLVLDQKLGCSLNLHTRASIDGANRVVGSRIGLSAGDLRGSCNYHARS